VHFVLAAVVGARRSGGWSGLSGARSAGKHPVGTNWGDRYARTEDDILAWDDGKPFNDKAYFKCIKKAGGGRRPRG
jgi:hypothetical protein